MDEHEPHLVVPPDAGPPLPLRSLVLGAAALAALVFGVVAHPLVPQGGEPVARGRAEQPSPTQPPSALETAWQERAHEAPAGGDSEGGGGAVEPHTGVGSDRDVTGLPAAQAARAGDAEESPGQQSGVAPTAAGERPTAGTGGEGNPPAQDQPGPEVSAGPAEPAPATAAPATEATVMAPPAPEPARPTLPSPAPTGGGASPEATRPAYRDGTWTGLEVSTDYGPVQVQVTVAGSSIVSAHALISPVGNATSRQITLGVIPVLDARVVQAQAATIDAVSGATLTFHAYRASLQAALDQARS